MIAIPLDKVRNIQKAYQSEIDMQRQNALDELNVLNSEKHTVVDKEYLEFVISKFENQNDNILLWDLNRIKEEINKIDFKNVPTEIKNGKTRKTGIKDKIIKCLGYTKLRSSFYPNYFNDIGIKACVYCNSQLTIVANKKHAKFEVDHFYSKSDYPFLSISLCNLYPACASCNGTKSSKKIEFELYTDDISKTKKSDYKFKLTSNSKAKYLVTRDRNNIEVEFEEPDYKSNEFAKFNDVFHVEGIYKTQNDLVEELLIKSQIYNESYLNILKSSFYKLNLNPEVFKRIIIGNYTEDIDIHKRPMSKITMDIARELGLID
ncbi:hypothetical protein LXD69_11800 [Flavobacterium sediminilitoris]|uniref:HNH endonuclease n=1 Tax=Flavobacterium sediminilitoris TaxID=2024526 RepID=A0ABY4HMN5_9FLAO|nr:MULTISPECIES: hypothetical protein [Flavobacterium]UOX32724.1 hypothetical protein LXD69_11800 [Flavobacterium sediminilitoris]